MYSIEILSVAHSFNIVFWFSFLMDFPIEMFQKCFIQYCMYNIALWCHYSLVCFDFKIEPISLLCNYQASISMAIRLYCLDVIRSVSFCLCWTAKGHNVSPILSTVGRQYQLSISCFFSTSLLFTFESWALIDAACVREKSRLSTGSFYT